MINKNYYNETIYTQDLFKGLPKIIENHKEDYTAYFLTITFEDTWAYHSRKQYEHFLCRLWMETNRGIEKAKSNTFSKAIFIPEPSYSRRLSRRQGISFENNIHQLSSVVSKINYRYKGLRNPHFHSIVMVHKENDKDFQEKILYKGQIDSTNITLHKKIFNRLNKILPVSTIDLRPIYNQAKISAYLEKHMHKIDEKYRRYTFSDVSKHAGTFNVPLQQNILSNENISSEDIYFFCHLSNERKKL